MRGDLTVRKTRTASGATAVQVVRYEGRRCNLVKHMGSAHDDDNPSFFLLMQPVMLSNTATSPPCILNRSKSMTFNAPVSLRTTSPNNHKS
jgi:hypothetical protein